MRTIHKYPLKLQERQLILTQTRPKLLTAQLQGDQLVLWVEVDEATKPTHPINIHIYGTGYQMPTLYPLIYIATVQKNGYVWHIFREDS